jgi:hypothetical protein
MGIDVNSLVTGNWLLAFQQGFRMSASHQRPVTSDQQPIALLSKMMMVIINPDDWYRPQTVLAA